jgi:excisionase family DNA binding protein
MTAATKTKRRRRSREERLSGMDKAILDVDGAATLLGVSTATIYKLARKGKIPGTRVGREWRFARPSLIQWVTNGSHADQLTTVLRKAKPIRRA